MASSQVSLFVVKRLLRKLHQFLRAQARSGQVSSGQVDTAQQMRQGDHPNWLVSPLCECSLLFSASRMFTAMIYHTDRHTDRQAIVISSFQHRTNCTYLACSTISRCSRSERSNLTHTYTHTRRRR
jgi:hypothetical protein